MPRKRRAQRRPQVERKIYFYRIDVGQDDAGRPLPFDPQPALQRVKDITTGSDAWYLFDEEDNALVCWVDRVTTPQRMRFGISRRSGLPSVERVGEVHPLSIPQNAGLAELVHVVFFAGGIVGSEFNFYGPRLSRLGAYLQTKVADLCHDITFQPLMRQDVLDQLLRMKQVRVLDLKVRVPFIQVIKDVDEDIGTALDKAAKAGDAQEIGLVLQPQAYKAGFLSASIGRLVRALAPRSDLSENARVFHVSGFDPKLGRMAEVDVLSEYLVSSRRIIRDRGRSRSLDQQSAYKEIERAFAELQPELERAATVSR